MKLQVQEETNRNEVEPTAGTQLELKRRLHSHRYAFQRGSVTLLPTNELQQDGKLVVIDDLRTRNMKIFGLNCKRNEILITVFDGMVGNVL